jgi:hypothetical protein
MFFSTGLSDGVADLVPVVYLMLFLFSSYGLLDGLDHMVYQFLPYFLYFGHSLNFAANVLMS